MAPTYPFEAVYIMAQPIIRGCAPGIWVGEFYPESGGKGIATRPIESGPIRYLLLAGQLVGVVRLRARVILHRLDWVVSG